MENFSICEKIPVLGFDEIGAFPCMVFMLSIDVYMVVL